MIALRSKVHSTILDWILVLRIVLQKYTNNITEFCFDNFKTVVVWLWSSVYKSTELLSITNFFNGIACKKFLTINIPFGLTISVQAKCLYRLFITEYENDRLILLLKSDHKLVIDHNHVHFFIRWNLINQILTFIVQ